MYFGLQAREFRECRLSHNHACLHMNPTPELAQAFVAILAVPVLEMSLTMDAMESMIHPALGSQAHRYRRDQMQISIPEDQDVYPPEAVQIRNTFIHVTTPEHGSEDASKHVLTCPASHSLEQWEVFKLVNSWSV